MASAEFRVEKLGDFVEQDSWRREYPGRTYAIRPPVFRQGPFTPPDGVATIVHVWTDRHRSIPTTEIYLEQEPVTEADLSRMRDGEELGPNFPSFNYEPASLTIPRISKERHEAAIKGLATLVSQLQGGDQ